MEVKMYSGIRTLVEVHGDLSDVLIPAGTRGTVVECFNNPEAYAVDLAIPDSSLVGGFRYENVALSPDQFEVIEAISRQ